MMSKQKQKTIHKIAWFWFDTFENHLPKFQLNCPHQTKIHVVVAMFGTADEALPIDVNARCPRVDESHCSSNTICANFSTDLNFRFFEYNSIASISVSNGSVDLSFWFCEWNYYGDKAPLTVHMPLHPKIGRKWT